MVGKGRLRLGLKWVVVRSRWRRGCEGVVGEGFRDEG